MKKILFVSIQSLSIVYLFSIIIQTLENFHNGGNILNINIHSKNLSSECRITFTMSHDYIQNYKSIYPTYHKSLYYTYVQSYAHLNHSLETLIRITALPIDNNHIFTVFIFT